MHESGFCFIKACLGLILLAVDLSVAMDRIIKPQIDEEIETSKRESSLAVVTIAESSVLLRFPASTPELPARTVFPFPT